MKAAWTRLSKVAAVTAITIMLSGCGTDRVYYKAADMPRFQTGSPLTGVRPKTFAFKEFRDVRDIGMLNEFAFRGFSDVTGSDASLLFKVVNTEFRLEEPVANVVTAAIKKELERNGHTCIGYAQQSNADFIVEGSIYNYSFNMTSLYFTKQMTGNVAVKLTVGNKSADKGVLTKCYVGEYQFETNAPTGGYGTGYEVLGLAQMAMVKEISTDPELVEFLDK